MKLEKGGWWLRKEEEEEGTSSDAILYPLVRRVSGVTSSAPSDSIRSRPKGKADEFPDRRSRARLTFCSQHAAPCKVTYLTPRIIMTFFNHYKPDDHTPDHLFLCKLGGFS